MTKFFHLSERENIDKAKKNIKALGITECVKLIDCLNDEKEVNALLDILRKASIELDMLVNFQKVMKIRDIGKGFENAFIESLARQVIGIAVGHKYAVPFIPVEVEMACGFSQLPKDDNNISPPVRI